MDAERINIPLDISNQRGPASKALIYLPWSGEAWFRILLETYIFNSNFSLPPRSERFSGAHTYEIMTIHL